MKLSVLGFALLMLSVSACGPDSSAPTSGDNTNGISKAVPSTFSFPFIVNSDCCGGEDLTIDMTYRQVIRDNGASYNWKANERVTGASGDSYHVTFTDNGSIRYDGNGDFSGWTGTLHMRIRRADGCTSTFTVKLRISIDANGNWVKDVYEVTETCG